MYGPCKTWIAWLVTEPELLATGEAVAETPPTVSPIADDGNSPISNAPIVGIYL